MQKSFILLFAVLSLLMSFHLDAYATYGERLCHTHGFHCLQVKRGQSWNSLWPDASERDLVMRINRMNIPVYPGMVLAVPDRLDDVDLMDFAPLPKRIAPTGQKEVIVSPASLAWGAYDTDGSLVRWGPISAGSDYCRDLGQPCHTHVGTFRVFSLGSSACYSHKFPLPHGGAPMPYCMYFNRGQALHGEPNGLPGYNASHGCVRLLVDDAEWLRYNFVDGPAPDDDNRGTTVIIQSY
jgi:hypothetical protein